MKEHWNNYLKIGLIHFMAYPQTIKGEGPILETLEKICEDDFFQAVEVSWIKDDPTREKVKNMLQASHLAVAYGAQPRLLVNKLNLNSFDEQERKKAVDCVKEGIEEASYLGAKAVAVLSGTDPGDAKRAEAKKLLIASLKELCGHAQRKNLSFVLETFDRDIDKKCLIGPSDEAAELSAEVRKDCPNFGLMIDLSHLPLLKESSKAAAKSVKKHLVHAHVGNCILKDKNHPAYGDQHPRFGAEGGENDVEQLREFLEALLDIGYLNEKTKPIVSFEVKPMAGESSELVIANAKRTLQQAWAAL